MKRPHEPLTARQPSAAHLIAAAVLLWLVWLVRAHNILQLPVFVDESLHIIRGKIVWEFSDWGESLNPKKLLYYYWIGLFGLNAPESAWLARMSTALAALPGAALTYALARRLFDRRAGLLALVLYALVPFMVFFERLALADAFTATICTAAIYTSIDLARRPAVWRGALVGALLGLAVLAKLIALPFVLIPPLAIFLYDRTPETRYTPGAILRAVFARSYRRPLIAAAALFLVVLAPSMTYVIGKEITGTKDRVVVEEDLYTADNRAEQIAENAERTFRAAITLLAPEFVALAGVLSAYLAWRRPRALAYLLASVLLPWGFVILVAGRPSTRYLVLGIPPLLVLVAGGVVDVTRWVAQHRGGEIEPNWKAVSRLHWLAWGLLALWALSFAVPFARQAMTDPTQLDLPARDEWEYFTSTASGYALRDLAADLPTLPPADDGRIPVIGFLPSCHSLPLYWTGDNAVELDCPLFGWNTTMQQAMTDHLLARAEAEPVLYMAIERLSLYDLDQLPFTWDLLAEYPRPHNGRVVELYRVRLAE